MAITTTEEVKALRQIDTDEFDEIITTLLPIVESDLLEYLANDFVDPATGQPNYPPPLKSYVADMVVFRTQKQLGSIKSESIGKYSVTYSDETSKMVSGYPAYIMLGLEKWRKLRWA